MCFDTISSNPGRYKGACIIQKQLLGRTLCTLAVDVMCRSMCRSRLFSGHEYFLQMCCCSSASKPSGNGSTIHTSFDDSSTDAYTSDAIADIKDDMVKKLESSVTVTQPRDDYRELMEFATIFLRGVPPRGICFSALGPCTMRAGSQRQYTLSK